MKISVEWLREFVDIDIPITELATRLTDQGVSVEGIEQIGDDYVLDLEITPNRPDQLSVFGIAREIKAMLRKELKNNPFKMQPDVKMQACPISVDIEDDADCPRYAGCLVENAKVGTSFDWMRKRLELSGIRSVNNIVDITNYVLLEMGHPLHAFDANCIKGGRILVRRARDVESITTLDGLKRKLNDTILVIADEKKPIALAGIMGGEASEIKNQTTHIFIESAYFEPTLIRRGAKQLAITSESSYRFERKADIQAPIPALIRARDLVIKLCKGTLKGGIADTYNRQNKDGKVSFTLEWLNGFLGSHFSREEVIDTLTAIDLPITGDTILDVHIPSFRRDIEIKEDIAEEVIRIVGFDKIPKNTMITFGKVTTLPQNDMKIRKIKDYFIACGFDEAVNISFLSFDEICNLKTGAVPIPLLNPITSNLTHLRPSLVPGLLHTAKSNFNIGLKDIRCFEIGNVYLKTPSAESIAEPLRIAGIVAGKVKNSDWRGENRLFDYYDLKGIIEGFLDLAQSPNVRFRKMQNTSALLDEGSRIYFENNEIGIMGCMSNEVIDSFNLSKQLHIFEIDLEPVLHCLSFDYAFKELPKYPAVLRDLCLLVPNEITHQQIKDTIINNSDGLVKTIQLFDTYQSEKISRDLRSFTYSLVFRSDSETLNDETVNSKITEIISRLSETLGVRLRGEE